MKYLISLLDEETTYHLHVHVSEYMYVRILCMLGNFTYAFCQRFFSRLTFKKSFRNTFGVTNNLDPDQARHFVGPDLDPNCLQRLSSEDSARQRLHRSITLTL